MFLDIPEYAQKNRILIMPRVIKPGLRVQNFEYDKVLNMAEFSICERYTAFWICQNMPWQCYVYISGSEDAREKARETDDSKYAIIWLNLSEWDVNMAEYVWIYNHRQSSEYVSYST